MKIVSHDVMQYEIPVFMNKTEPFVDALIMMNQHISNNSHQTLSLSGGRGLGTRPAFLRLR